MGLRALPDHLLKSMPNLTWLNLSDNIFDEIPHIVTELRNLKTLQLLNNPPLQLSLGCMEVLIELPNLRCLQMAKGSRHEGVWSLDSFEAISAIRAALPDLELILSY
jgi:hypothetical protein